MFKFKVRFEGFRGGETGSTEGTGKGFKRNRGGEGTFKELVEMI